MNKILLSVLIISLLLSACEDEKNQTEKNKNIPDNIDTTDYVSVIKDVYYSLPSPMEMATVIKKYSVDFNPDSLHKTELYESYTTTKSKAVNMGIYAGDLAFISIYEQYQYSTEYYQTIVKLADDIGIIEGINDTLVQEVEKNIDNPSKIKKIIAEAFFKSDAFLKENNKEYISTYILVGAWVESFYILSNFVKNNQTSEELMQLFIDQRLILKNVMKLVNENFEKSTVKELEELQNMLNNCVKITKKDVLDPYTDSMKTKTFVDYQYKPEDVEKINKKISKIRKIFVSLH